jgi:hypothetical protein
VIAGKEFVAKPDRVIEHELFQWIRTYIVVRGDRCGVDRLQEALIDIGWDDHITILEGILGIESTVGLCVNGRVGGCV